MSRRSALVLAALGLWAACPPVQGTETTDSGTSTGTTSTAHPTTGSSCQPGELVCQGNSVLWCNESGHLGPPVACPFACDEVLGCIACPPGQIVCDGDALTQCGDAGESGHIIAFCDPVQGLTCDAEAGACAGACAADPARPSELGCEFWSVALPSRVFNLAGYGVGITTTCDVPTKLSIEVAGAKVASDTLATASPPTETAPSRSTVANC